MKMKSVWKKAGMLAVCSIVAVAFAAALGGCGNDEEALPEENVKYEIAL